MSTNSTTERNYSRDADTFTVIDKAVDQIDDTINNLGHDSENEDQNDDFVSVKETFLDFVDAYEEFKKGVANGRN